MLSIQLVSDVSNPIFIVKSVPCFSFESCELTYISQNMDCKIVFVEKSRGWI